MLVINLNCASNYVAQIRITSKIVLQYTGVFYALTVCEAFFFY